MPRRSWIALAAAAAGLACQRDAPPAPALPALGPAERAAIGDLDGDRRGEIALADATRLRVFDRSGRELAAMAAPGATQALVVADVDGDGRSEIAAGWGRDRAHPQATARVSLLRLEGGQLREEVVVEPASERPQIAAILPDPPGLFLAWYDSQYLVKSGFARPAAGGWTIEEVATLRTAGAYALGDLDGDRQRDLVVGRFYGDALASDGDAFLLRPGGERVAIPTTRGVHAFALADGDGDGRLDLFLADGWHKDYGAQARALLTWSRWQGGAFRSARVDELEGEYTIWSLLAADLDGDRRAELVARGSGSVRVYAAHGGTWRGRKVAGAALDIAAGEVDGAPGDELLAVGADGATWIGAE